MQFRRVSGRDSAQVVTPFVQVGTSCDSTVTSGTDYAFISSLDESPRIASAVDLPSGMTEASPSSGSVVTGPCLFEAEGFPRHYPVQSTGGFAVMSGIDVRAHARTGQLCLPDKEFRYLRQLCYPHLL